MALDSISVDTSNASSIVFTGFTTVNSGGVTPLFRHYFHGTLEAESGCSALPVLATGTLTDGGSQTKAAFVDLDPSACPTQVSYLVRVATSFISQTQAGVSFASEVAGRSFDEVVAESKAQWQDAFARVQIQDVGSGYTSAEESDLLTTFYSCLYRALLFPRNLGETSANGTELHYSPYDGLGLTYPGPLSTDSGAWDSYRTVYPLLSLLFPEQLGVIMQGWVNAYHEGGWLPKWASPGYRGSMVGTMQDVFVADAIVKNITGFDQRAAYEAIRKDAFVIPDPNGSSGVGRTCLSGYLQNGYVPIDGSCSEEVSRSLNYMLADFSIAQAAAKLGFSADAAILEARSKNYSRLFEPSTAFMRGRDGSGNWTEPFDQFRWGSPYTEAGPWQYRFYVPWDTEGLRALYAQTGRDICDALDAAQTMPSVYHIGAYDSVIHEQTEMAELCWGQYEHNNQPVHHVLYTFIAVDENNGGVAGSCAAKGQAWLRQAMTKLYKPGADMFCGDEDNGEMASWYILSALGVYALAPGSTAYTLGSPLFAQVKLSLGNGNVLDIAAPGNSAGTPYVESVSLNGVGVSGTTVDYFDLMRGGVLHFAVSSNGTSLARTFP
jgi:predicted alpha-1,2-mannosidase